MIIFAPIRLFGGGAFALEPVKSKSLACLRYLVGFAGFFIFKKYSYKSLEI